MDNNNPELTFWHFGDIDAGGFYIHEHLCRVTGIPFGLYRMSRKELENPFFQSCLRPLTKQDRIRLKSLEKQELYRDSVIYMLGNNVKLEQEIIFCIRKFVEGYMNIQKCVKESFVVIGKEGSTLDGEGFIQRLWVDANSHFEEVQHLAKKDERGKISGIWGAMSDFSHSFKPWEDFSKGLYLAGVECRDDAKAPNGWTKWIIPGYEYIYIECENEATFSETIKYLKDNAIPLVGAVHDFTCPQTGKNYMFFPIRKLHGHPLI